MLWSSSKRLYPRVVARKYVKRVYTIGHSNRGLEEFLTIIRRHGIQVIYDVRSFPTSRIVPHFSKLELSESLREMGVGYVWDGRLGGFRRFGRDVEDYGLATCFKSEGFRAYATYLVMSDEARRAGEELAAVAEKYLTAIMCRERIPWRCHRKILSDLMLAKGFQVIHLIDEGWAVEHKPSKCAEIRDGRLTYV